MSESRKRRQRRGKPGSLTDLKRELWHAVVCAADLLDSEDDKVKLSAVHAVSQSAASYRALCEASDFEQRIAALEEREQATSQHKKGPHP